MSSQSPVVFGLRLEVHYLVIWGCFHLMRKAFDSKRYWMLKVELYSVSPDWIEYCFMYEKSDACGYFDWRPCNQYILVR
jgi:hypothetical protein